MKCILAILIFACGSITASAGLTVFAAASTTEALKELAAAYTERTGESIRFNFAGSGTLARQIEAGAPADLFISANAAWMDYLAQKQLLQEGTRSDVANNALVLIAPADSSLSYEEFPGNLKGRLAVGDFRSVPAGTYAEAALASLGWLDTVQSRLIKGSNVRTVLMYVERGEVDAGIVYQTDALQSDRVKLIGTFPADSHPPIVYPAACIKNSSPAAKDFLTFLESKEGQTIFKQYGFTEPQK